MTKYTFWTIFVFWINGYSKSTGWVSWKSPPDELEQVHIHSKKILKNADIATKYPKKNRQFQISSVSYFEWTGS